MAVSDTPPAAAVHPFAENIVKDPRRVEPPITGLNDRPLQRLMDEFGALEADHLPPRKTQLSHAVLVTSAEPGYGKSHLLGRYLRTLDRRASKIYIKPFQNPSLCWQSILLRTIQKLNFPDRSDVEFGQPGEPTQLDALAIGIFAHLIAAGLDSGEIGHENSEWAAGYLRSDPIDAFGFADEANSWADWMRQYFDELLPIFEGQLDRHGLSLTPSAPAWLRVLFRYSFWPRDVTLRRTCLSWLKGESIESDEGRASGRERASCHGPKCRRSTSTTSAKSASSTSARFRDFTGRSFSASTRPRSTGTSPTWRGASAWSSPRWCARASTR